MNSKYLKIQSNIDALIYIVLLFAVIWFRYLILINFGFKYTDSDQAIMWFALDNYSNGIIHEPRFYGQSYNTMLEAVLAIPFFKAGVSNYIILPIITSVLSLFPYILISIFTFRKKAKFISLVILSIPLLLPIEYSMLTSISRGFVTGIFVAVIGSISIFYHKSRWGFFIVGFLSIIGYSVSANSVLVSVPCLLYLFLINITNIKFYINTGIGIIIAGMIHFAINSFYIFNPFYNIRIYPLEYSFTLLLDSIQNMDRFFNNVSPIFWNQGFMSIVMLLFISFVLFRQKQSIPGIFLLLIPIIIILTLGINKIHDGVNSIFFSSSRMYLAIPVLIGLSLSFIKITNNKYYYLYFIIPLVMLTYKANNLDESINVNVSSSHYFVSVCKVDEVIAECKKLSHICKQNNVELIIVINHYNYDFFTFACSTCTDEFPRTLRPSYERRTWRLVEDEKINYNNILLIDSDNHLSEKFEFIQRVQLNEDLYLIQNNDLYTMDLLNTLGVKVRKYK